MPPCPLRGHSGGGGDDGDDDDGNDDDDDDDVGALLGWGVVWSGGMG